MKEKKNKTLKQLSSRIAVEYPMYYSLFSRISIKPQIKLCDITGLPAKYICPRTGLQYCNSKIYSRIREMPTDTAQIIGGIRQIGKELAKQNRK